MDIVGLSTRFSFTFRAKTANFDAKTAFFSNKGDFKLDMGIFMYFTNHFRPKNYFNPAWNVFGAGQLRLGNHSALKMAPMRTKRLHKTEDPQNHW